MKYFIYAIIILVLVITFTCNRAISEDEAE